jgi:hypothetical protein
MTIDKTILAATEPQNKLPHATDTHATKGKNNIYLRFIAWYAFWMAIVLALYWPVLPALPYRDHPFLMLNRQLAGNDWTWFWSMLSYPRTRVLLPGDYFAFRPVHMAIIGLQDIFLRYHLIAQGVVNCMQFAFAAVVFSSMVKRFVGTFAALAFTFLWVSQLAGATIVMWQHITPYILCPALFILAVRILDGDDLELSPLAKLILGAICVFLATLLHEIGVATALSISLLAVFFGHRDTERRRQLLIVFFVPVACSLLLNMIDYFIIHRPPSLLGASDILSYQSTIFFIAKFIGAIGTALLFSSALHLEQMRDGFTLWPFYNESSVLLACMALLTSALFLTACIKAVLEWRRSGISRQVLFMTLLLSFFVATFAVCVFRMYSREPSYMAQASYYYSLFSLALSGLAAALLHTVKKNVVNSAVSMILVVSVFHVTASQAYFSKIGDHRKVIYRTVTEGRKILTQNPGLCFNGFIPTAISYSSLFYDVSCANRPKAAPLYIFSDENNKLWFASILYSNNARLAETVVPQLERIPGNNGLAISRDIPAGHDLQFTANMVGDLVIMLTSQTGIQQIIAIERSLIKIAVWPDPMIYNGVLDKDAATSAFTYRFGFTQDSILLFANGRWIGELPAFPVGTSSINIALLTKNNNHLDIRDMRISEHPALGTLQLFSRYNLVTQ